MAKRRMTARRIAAWHRARGESQEAAAQAAGVARQTVSTWELDNDDPYWVEFRRAFWQHVREGGAEGWLTLRNSLRDENASVRVAAASKLVDILAKEFPNKHEITGPEGGAIREYVIWKPVEKDGGGDE